MLIPDILNQKSRRQKLDRFGYLGYEILSIYQIVGDLISTSKYALTSDGVCHRTQVAIRGLILNDKDFRKFVHGQEGIEAHDEAQANEFIATKVLQVYSWEAEEALKALQRVNNVGMQVQKRTLVKRWVQIRDMIQRAHGNGVDPTSI